MRFVFISACTFMHGYTSLMFQLQNILNSNLLVRMVILAILLTIHEAAGEHMSASDALPSGVQYWTFLFGFWWYVIELGCWRMRRVNPNVLPMLFQRLLTLGQHWPNVGLISQAHKNARFCQVSTNCPLGGRGTVCMSSAELGMWEMTEENISHSVIKP